MKRLLVLLLLVLIADALLSRCANPKPPQGGAKDSIPPTLVRAIPEIGALNVSTTEIVLEFDEWISAEKLSANLIITPQLDSKYKTLVKKNKLILKFDKPFPDSTTITLNFFDGLTDITEKNPAVNLIYVFSTGTYLDSLRVSGNVYDLFTDKEQEKFSVGLFPYTDTIDIYKSKPMYFSATNKEGSFAISNIKKGIYKVVAFKDENRNMQFDAANESYGFLAAPIQLDSNISEVSLATVKINATKIRKFSAKANGQYYDVRYNKSLDSIRLTGDLYYQLLDDKLTVRIYKPKEFQNYADSIKSILHTQDSLGNISRDTLFVKFSDQSRKLGKFEAKLTPNIKTVDIQNTFELTFTKPVASFNPSLIHWKRDTLYQTPLDTATNFKWNHAKTKLQFIQTFDTTAYISFQKSYLQKEDSTQTDSIIIKPNPAPIGTKPGKNDNKQPSISRSIDLAFEKGTFISVESDTLALLSQNYSFYQQKQTGKLIINIDTDIPAYSIQLINKQYQVIREFGQTKRIQADNLPPGDYGVRILIDSNQDGKWSFGNIIKNQEPEPIYIHSEFTSLRANWEVSMDISVKSVDK